MYKYGPDICLYSTISTKNEGFEKCLSFQSYKDSGYDIVRVQSSNPSQSKSKTSAIPSPVIESSIMIQVRPKILAYKSVSHFYSNTSTYKDYEWRAFKSVSHFSHRTNLDAKLSGYKVRILFKLDIKLPPFQVLH